MTTQDDLVALTGFFADSRLRELGEHVPELSFLSLIPNRRDELMHSRIIAALFDPRRHRQAEQALRAFVAALGVELAGVEAATRAAYDRLTSSAWSTIRVRRELFRIDVVVEIVSPVGTLVIGIENKIGAAEQQTQIARYQESLARAFPNQTVVLAFLAPQKRLPTTADASSRIPVLPIDYSSVLAAVSSAIRVAVPKTSDYFVLSEIAQHLREDILEDTRVRDLARQLWKERPRALELALEHRPRMADIQHAYESRLRHRFGNDAILTQYPTRGELRELKLSLRSWTAAGFPFVFMLYTNFGDSPRIRLLLWSDTFEEKPQQFRTWARRVNRAAPRMIDEDFQPISDWPCWRRVFAEDEYPEGAVLQATGFDAETVNEAEARISALMDSLRQFMPDGV